MKSLTVTVTAPQGTELKASINEEKEMLRMIRARGETKIANALGGWEGPSTAVCSGPAANSWACPPCSPDALEASVHLLEQCR